MLKFEVKTTKNIKKSKNFPKNIKKALDYSPFIEYTY